jgi:hypothetical protein
MVEIPAPGETALGYSVAPINRPELQKRLYMLLSMTKLFMGHHSSHPHPDEPGL